MSEAFTPWLEPEEESEPAWALDDPFDRGWPEEVYASVGEYALYRRDVTEARQARCPVCQGRGIIQVVSG